MLDPLDALRRGPERVAPRPEFEREVLARVRDELRRTNRRSPFCTGRSCRGRFRQRVRRDRRGVGDVARNGSGVRSVRHGILFVESCADGGRSDVRDGAAGCGDPVGRPLPSASSRLARASRSDFGFGVARGARKPRPGARLGRILRDRVGGGELDRCVESVGSPARAGRVRRRNATASCAPRTPQGAWGRRRLRRAATNSPRHSATGPRVTRRFPRRPGPPAHLFPAEALSRVEQLDLRDRANWVLFIQPIAKLSSLLVLRELLPISSTSKVIRPRSCQSSASRSRRSW